MKYFLKRSLFLYFRKKEPRKSSFVFQKVTFRARKCFLFFKKWNFSIPSFSHINVLELTLSTNNIYSVYFFRARKYFLFFKKWNFSIPSLKTLVLFLGEPLQVFNYCFFGCFVSPSIFTIVFGCFHCWLYLFTSLFLLCYDFFYQALFLCCYTAKATGIFYLTLLPDIWCNVGCSNDTIAPTCFYQDFPGHKQFRFEGSKASHWGSKQRPGPSVCLNHTVFSKRY